MKNYLIEHLSGFSVLLGKSRARASIFSRRKSLNLGQDSHIFSLSDRQKSSTNGLVVFLIIFLLITSCGGSTGTDSSGASLGTDYGKKTVYDTSWRIIYYVEKDRVYTDSWSLAYHLEENKVYDPSWRLVARIDGDQIYSEDWSLLYRIDGDRIYDPSWRLAYYIADRS